MTTFEDLLSRDGYLVYKIRGVSMEPMLRQNRDLVVIHVPTARLKKYDVALYKRGDAYVLHRVIRVESDHYLIRGDNTYTMEYVPDSSVIGVLTEFKRKGKKHNVSGNGYRIYVRFWQMIYPFRAVYARTRRILAKIFHKSGIIDVIKRKR